MEDSEQKSVAAQTESRQSEVTEVSVDEIDLAGFVPVPVFNTTDPIDDDSAADEPVDTEAFSRPDPLNKAKVEYVERTQERLDLSGFVLVRREMFAKTNCPSITIKYDTVYFNVRAIKKLDGCPFIQILINPATNRLIVRPCEEDDKESVQWCRTNKDGKLVPKHIGARLFSAKLYSDLGWNASATMKMLGTLVKAGNEKIFVFEMKNAEAYMTMASQTDENRRVRVPFYPEQWAIEFGPTLEEHNKGLISTYEGVPEGFVSIRMAPVKNKGKIAPSSTQTVEEKPDTQAEVGNLDSVKDEIAAATANEINNVEEKGDGTIE